MTTRAEKILGWIRTDDSKAFEFVKEVEALLVLHRNQVLLSQIQTILDPQSYILVNAYFVALGYSYVAIEPVTTVSKEFPPTTTKVFMKDPALIRF